jgi:hypothetical protein
MKIESKKQMLNAMQDHAEAMLTECGRLKAEFPAQVADHEARCKAAIRSSFDVQKVSIIGFVQGIKGGN